MNQLPCFAIELLNSPTYILMRVATMSGNLALCFMPCKVTCSVNTRLDYGTKISHIHLFALTVAVPFTVVR